MSLFNADEATRAKRLDGLKKIGKALVGAGLPVLGTAVAGPAGGIVAANVVRSLNLGPEASEHDVEMALASNPDAIVELRRYEAEILTAQYQAASVEQEEVTKRHGQDMLSDSWLSKNIRPLICAVFVASFVVYVFASTFLLDTEDKQSALWMGGQLGGVLTPVLLFYFGGRTQEKKEKAKTAAQVEMMTGGFN